jgi:hypothetical protein
MSAISMATFTNIIVTVTVVDGNLQLNYRETIVCTAPDTIPEFHLVQEKDLERDDCFSAPGMSGDTGQPGVLTISRSGKMLTMCDERIESASGQPARRPSRQLHAVLLL